MSCVDNTCGTGDWTGPKPGDPSNNVTLSANTVFGGISVSWSYPTTNPEAVAHTILYRGLSEDFNLALQVGVIAGSIYFDSIDDEQPVTYYYWIEIVSVNGTVGERIGPASTTSRPRSTETLESLTGRIDQGVLAQALKTEIARIPEIDDKLFQEIDDRIASNQVLGDALTAVQNELGTAMTYINEEITQRTEGDVALVDSINAIAAGSGDNAAAIAAERLVRASKDEALAQDILVLDARTDTNEAAIIQESTVRSNADSAMASTINALSAEVDDNRAAILTEQTVRADADTALSSQVTTLFSRVGAADAAIQTEATTRATADTALATNVTTLNSRVGASEAAIKSESSTRASADSALAGNITTVESELNGNIAQLEVSLTTEINTVDGKVNEIGSLYTVKVNVNGLAGGFGVYNDGTEVQAGFDVDTFWVGRTNADKVKPFIISNGIVYIDKARIRNADIDTLKIAGNAVTVPFAQTFYTDTPGSGINNWMVVASGTIYLDQPGVVYAASSALVAYGTGWVAAQTRLEINGGTVAIAGGTEGYITVAHSAGLYCNAGPVTVSLLYASDSGARLVTPTIFIQGAKR